MKINISPPSGPLKSGIVLPGSKSISNRLLIMSRLSHSTPQLKNLSVAEDTVLLKKLLAGNENTYNVKNAGTVARFLTALFSVLEGERILTGDERMLERPVGPLVEALIKLGAQITYLEREGFFPVKITGKKLKGGKIKIDSRISSQFITALMLIAPKLANGLEIELGGKPVSEPYIHMTIHMMRQAGVDVQLRKGNIQVSRGGYLISNWEVEADWSSAAFWFEAAALRKGSELKLKGLTPFSLQGDSWCEELFHPLGIDTIQEEDGIRIRSEETLLNHVVRPRDFSDHPDLALPYGASLSGLRLKGTLNGLETLRFKESDRLTAMAVELEKAGSRCQVLGDILTIEPGSEKKKDFHFKSYADHRVIMSLAPLSLVLGEISIEDPDHIGKSYPNYWDELKKCGFTVTRTE